MGFFWPKIFWDFLTKTLDPSVKPIPILQSVNLVFGIVMLALEWPLNIIAGSTVHRSLEFRLAIIPLIALAAALMYQTSGLAAWYVIGMVAYFKAYSEGEVRLPCDAIDMCLPVETNTTAQIICATPWTLPQRDPSLGPTRA